MNSIPTYRTSRRPRRTTDARSAGRTVRFGSVALGVVLSAALLFGGLASTGCSGLPDPSIEGAKGRDQTTFIYDRNGAVIAKLHGGQNRVDRKLDKIPENLRNAVVATEDKRFYEHSGVDPLGILRAVFANASAGSAAQGGSTITQQYVKNAFFTQEKTFSRKIQEAMLAQELETKYSKDQILELYLNTIYFGHGAYGVEAASQAYFGKGVERLNLQESALLAGVIKSPGHYSPYLNKKAAKERRDLVLQLMRDQGYISADEYTNAVDSKVKVAGLKKQSAIAPYFMEYVKERLVREFGPQVVYGGGLRVKTTLDRNMQKAAEAAVAAELDRKGDPSAALVAIKPGTGEIRAMVGGRDFDSQQFNVATQGRRQPGSSFKPFVLATALKEGMNPESLIDARATTIELPDGPWKVSGSSEGDKMRLRRATEKSVNAVFAHLITEVGPEKVAELAKELGITTKITPVPAIALGGHKEGVSPLEMASAYATLAANGKQADPYAISKVTDASGKVWFEHEKKTERVLSAPIAYLVTDILRGVITDGTGGAADIGRPAAGKTGTTQEYRDAWFVGYTPDLAASVWVGYPEKQREMTDVHGERVTGGSFPARIWNRFMSEALAKTPEHDFTRPDGLVERRVCYDTGKVATSMCPDTFGGLFLADAVPGKCTLHKEPPKVEVPSVLGKTESEASALLKDAGFVVSVQEKVIADLEPGTVTDQTPGGGTTAPKGSTVTITVAAAAATPSLEAIIDGLGSAKVGEALSFDGSGSTGDIQGWEWDFGDGSGASGPSASHAYASPGSYTVSLTITDRTGASATTVKRVKIQPARP